MIIYLCDHSTPMETYDADTGFGLVIVLERAGYHLQSTKKIVSLIIRTYATSVSNVRGLVSLKTEKWV